MSAGLPPKMTFVQRPDQVTEFEWLLLEIERIDGCERTKARLMELLKAQAGRVIRFTFRALVRPDQVKRARELLDAGNPTPVVRDRLCDLYHCTPRTAYNLIRKAIQQRGQERAECMRAAQQNLQL